MATALAERGFTTINLAADGSGVCSTTDGKTLAIQSQARTVTLAEPAGPFKHSVREMADILKVAQEYLPAQIYVAVNQLFQLHVDVTSGTAREFLNMFAFKNPKALDALCGEVGAGLKVFLDRQGTSAVLIEPLLSDPRKLYVQFNRLRIKQMSLEQLSEDVGPSFESDQEQALKTLAELVKEQG